MADEVRTTDILRAALLANKECFIPRYVGSVMDMVKLHSWEDFMSLPETSWKIKQPADDDNTRETATDTGIFHNITVESYTVIYAANSYTYYY